MQLDFTYRISDLRESLVPEAHAAKASRYTRWRVWKILLTFAFYALICFEIWIQERLQDASGTQAVNVPHDLRLELLPALFPALYVCVLYVVTIIRTWRTARRPELAIHQPVNQSSRLARLIPVVFVGGAVEWGLTANWNSIWYPTRMQILLVTAAPWIVVIILMQVLGILQQPCNTWRRWRGNEGWRRPQSVSLDATFFRVDDGVTRRECIWAYFGRARETDNLLVLMGEGGTQYVIPKRIFPDPVDLERCRSLLQNVIASTQFLATPVGFAVLPKPVLPLPEFESQGQPNTEGKTA